MENKFNKRLQRERLERAAKIRKQYPLKEWTITAIAAKLGISKQAVSRILRK